MAGPIRIAILANGRQARREVELTTGSLGGLGSVSKKVALGGFGLLTAGALALGKSVVGTEKTFSTSMRTLQAATNAPAEEMKRLNALAIKLGADTSFSANEAADAMLELGRSGLSTSKIIAAVPQVMNLAATEGIDLAQAAGIVTSSLSQFQLEASKSSTVVNALAGASNASRSSVASLGESLKLVGSAGSGIGLSVNETAAALAALSDAGLDGSIAGTSLAAVFNRLIPQTEKAGTAMYDLGLNFVKSNGDFVDIVQIAGRLQTALKKVRGEANRKAKISAIFGNDASTIAAVNALVSKGADGLRGYLKATKDQNAAQKLAAARLDGTEGALERFSGAMETARLRLGQELAPLVVESADALGDKLVPAMETGIRAGKDLGKALGPAASEIAEALGHLSGEGDGVGRMFDDVLIPAVRTASEVIGGLVDFIDDLPGPVKDVGLQVGIAALVFPRLAAGVTTATGAITLNIAKLQQLRAEMTYTATRAQLTGAAMSRMGTLAKSAAGIGGFALLTQSATEANGALVALERAAGGALAGFSVGGPVGAAIGGVIGLGSAFSGLQTSIADALLGESEWNQSSAHVEAIAKARADAVAGYAGSIDRLRASLNQFNGAVTAETRVKALDELERQLPGITAEMERLGISQRTLAKAATGNADALAKVNSVYNATDGPLKKYKFNQDQIGDALDNVGMKVGKVSKDLRDQARVTQDLTSLQGKIPKAIYTKIEATGIEPTTRGVADVAAKYKLLDRKQITALIKASGAETTVKQVERVIRSARDANANLAKVGKVNPNPQLGKKFKLDLDSLFSLAKPRITGLNNTLLNQTGNVKPNIVHGPFGRGVSGDLSALIAITRNKGNGVGDNLGKGMYGGMGPWISPIAERARSMVAGAVAAANAAAAIRSPSRKTAYTGDMLGAGLALGLRRSAPKAKASGKALVLAVLAGVTGGSAGVDKALAKITAQIEKSVTGKKQAQVERALLRRYAAQYAALRKNGKAQDAVNAKLEKARDRLKELQDQYRDYARSIRDSLIATGDVTQLGRQEDGTVSLKSLLDELRTKVNNSKRFAVLLQQLATKGLSKTAIQQMLDAGPESALATAEAIATGGAEAIKEINALQASLAATGTTLGDAMAKRYYGAGVAAAKGLVKGLEAEAKKLDAAGVRMANVLVAAVKKALGIRSPSRVFTGIGDNVIRGLDIGVDQTYVRRTGALAAASLQKGFGTPALDAFTTSRTAAEPPVIRVQVQLTAEMISAAQRGKAIMLDIEAARGQAARTSAVVGS